jgi:Fe2+ or Zn2+ uptake regulation protein
VDAPVARKLSEPELAELIRETGLRVTRPRLLILSLLDELGGHHSADALCEILERKNVLLPRASVFNVLNDLVQHSLVMQADVGPGRALYEFKTQWHHHFVCRECGGIVDVPCSANGKPCLETGIKGLHADEAQVIFRGPCPVNASNRPSECARK